MGLVVGLVAGLVVGVLGQFLVLQSLVDVLKPKQVPPLASSILLDRDLDCVPPPQFFEHEEYLLQLDHSQFTEITSFTIKNGNFDSKHTANIRIQWKLGHHR